MPRKESFVVRGTEILPTDTDQERLQKIARIMLDEMYQFVGMLDVDGRMLECNRAALEGGGLSREEVIGKPFWDTFWWSVSAKAQADLRDAVERAAQGEAIRYDVELYGRKSGKETSTMDFTLFPVRDQHGDVVLLLPEARDITEKKAREREVAQKTIELQGLLQRIRELDEIKTQFFANVSHELRTPLALILGPAQRLIDDDGSLSVSDRKEAATVIARNARMLLKHVNDLLDMSKLDAGKLKIEQHDTDVAALVRLLASHFAVLAAERGLELVVEADAACVVAVDADKLQRVVMNLLANAFKFVPQGGRIRARVVQEAHELTITVEDSGPGVPPELRSVIFERFRQGDGGTTRKVGGTGLGLAIAKELVELHKGRIEVLDSELGGALFRITLPCAQSTARAHEPTLDPTALRGILEELRPAVVQSVETPEADAPHVLVVEDNADMNRFVTQCLAAHYRVTSAFDGAEGLEKALALRPTLVVTDIMMPNVDGATMIAEMRARPELADMPILLLSAKADEQLMVRLLDNGAQDFIVKPFNEKELLVRVRNLVGARQAREEAVALRRAAEAANRSKDEFLAMLGHELRNPLSPIVTALQLMKMRPQGSERARIVIERQVKHLARLVDDLLDVARIARGKVELDREVIELSEIAARAIEMASPMIEQRGHALSIDIARTGLLVDGDPTRLAQVVSNLLTNAAKYTPAGGRISMLGEGEGDHVVLRVIDSGVGIAPDTLPHIFDLFVQERQALDRSHGGLGIGLAIVRNLVERHGGSVAAHSAGVGHGTELVVRLPRTARPAAEAASRTSARIASVAAENALRVLIVDDNEDAADMLGELLARRGYTTRIAHDAITALRVASELVPDVAFLDIGLPVMNGYELATHLRALSSLAKLRLVAVTGYGQEADRMRAAQAGFDRHLVKPVELEQLEHVIQALAGEAGGT